MSLLKGLRPLEDLLYTSEELVMSDNRKLVAVLLSLFFGAVFIMTHLLPPTKPEHNVGVMKSILRTVGDSAESWYARNGTYAGFRPQKMWPHSMTVKMVGEQDADVWAASATHKGAPGITCTLSRSRSNVVDSRGMKCE